MDKLFKAVVVFLLLGLVACNQATLTSPPIQEPPSPKNTAPDNPANLKAIALSSTQAKLAWDAVSDANTYTLEQQNADNSYSKISDLEATTATLDSLKPSTTYVFRVKANNAAGSSGGAEVSLTTPPAPQPAPSPAPEPAPEPTPAPTPTPIPTPVLQSPGAPSNLAVTPSATSALLKWSAPTSGGAVETYTLERGLGSNPTKWTTVPIDSVIFLSQYDGSLAPRLSYTYRLRANNAAGSSAWVSQTFTTPTAASPGFKIEELATDINVAWAMRFDPTNSKRIYFTPRDSAVLQIHRIDLTTKAIAKFVSDSGQAVRYGGGTESGVLGMDLDPNFTTNRWAYVCYGYYDASGSSKVRISRVELNESSQSLRNERYLLTNIPGGFYHNGCRVLYGPDNKLYITTGDGQYGDAAQNVNSMAGKSLRINPDGSIPSDNPFPGNPVFTLGHRNPQGIAFHPVTGQLWSTEHGPQTRDEINILKAGKNYGWPICLGTQAYGSSISTPDGVYTCSGIDAQDYVPSVVEYTSSGTIAPSNLIFYPLTGSAFPAWRGSLFFNNLKTGRLYRLETSGESVTKEEILIDNTQGRLRDIVAGPDGYIYISTDAGRLIRLIPQ